MRFQGFRVLAAVSGMIAVAVGTVLAAKAPCLLVEEITESSYSIGPITPFPILPALIMVAGVLSFASARKGHRLLSPLTAVCLGLFITSLTFSVPMGGGFRVEKFGYPFGWLAWLTSPALVGGSRAPHIMGVIALPFLVDLVFWTLVVGVVIFDVRYLWSYFTSRRGMHIHLKTAEAAWLLACMVIGGNPYWLIPAVLTWVLLKRWVYG